MKISVLGPQFVFASPTDSAESQSSVETRESTIEKVEATESDLDQETKDGLSRLLQFVKKKNKVKKSPSHADSAREKAHAAYQIAADGSSLDSARGISINIIC